MKESLKNYGTWTALLSQIVIIITLLNVRVDIDTFQGVILGVLNILVILGVLSNPLEGKWFKNEK